MTRTWLAQWERMGRRRLLVVITYSQLGRSLKENRRVVSNKRHDVGSVKMQRSEHPAHIDLVSVFFFAQLLQRLGGFCSELPCHRQLGTRGIVLVLVITGGRRQHEAQLANDG